MSRKILRSDGAPGKNWLQESTAGRRRVGELEVRKLELEGGEEQCGHGKRGARKRPQINRRKYQVRWMERNQQRNTWTPEHHQPKTRAGL